MTKLSIVDELLQEEDLFEYAEIECSKGVEALRIDRYLQSRIAGVSRNRIQDAIRSGGVTVNGKSIKNNYKVAPFDKIVFLSKKLPNVDEVIPEKMDIHIVYEDDTLMVVYKPAGMVVHPGFGNYKGTLLNGIAYYLREQLGEDIYALSRIGLVHRIDKETSGLLLIAKTSEASSSLCKQFFEHTVHRQYIGLVWGNIEEEHGTIDAHIGRHQRNRKMFDTYPDGDVGKHAITHYKVIERFGYTTLVLFQLETGRTHQIRVHMKSKSHPLFMDKTYGGDQIQKGVIFSKYKQFVETAFGICPRHALHAKSIGFIHPKTKEELRFDTELPQDMSLLINRWRDYVKEA